MVMAGIDLLLDTPATLLAGPGLEAYARSIADPASPHYLPEVVGTSDPNSFWLTIALAGGAVAALLILGALAWLWLRLWRNLRAHTSSNVGSGSARRVNLTSLHLLWIVAWLPPWVLIQNSGEHAFPGRYRRALRLRPRACRGLCGASGGCVRSGVDGRRVPDFFIVGAPRCGTTALYHYLRQHPQIFMPHRKEPCYFCPDLDTGTTEEAIQFTREPERYFSLFEGVSAAMLAGEACAVYLYSLEAPQRITAARPDARILIMLRDPVEQMYLHHSVRQAGDHEDLDFADALAMEAEADRYPAGPPAHSAPRTRMLPMNRYKWAARYTEHVARYLDHFGRDRVRVMLLEELSAEPERLYRETLEFLGVDTSFRPAFEVVNANRVVRATLPMRILRSPRLILAGRRLVPRRLRPKAGRLAEVVLDAGLRGRLGRQWIRFSGAELIAELRPEVARC